MCLLFSVSYVFEICNRCSAKQSGELGSSSEAVDGIVGFGQANSSILSQLASSEKVKKIFSHCLDGNKGGGIFAIGEVVQPKFNRTPLVPNEYVMSTCLFVSFFLSSPLFSWTKLELLCGKPMPLVFHLLLQQSYYCDLFSRSYH